MYAGKLNREGLATDGPLEQLGMYIEQQGDINAHVCPVSQTNHLVIKADILKNAELPFLIFQHDTQWGPGVLATYEVEGPGSFTNGTVDRRLSMDETHNWRE